MIRALILAALLAATTSASASELDAGYPTPSEVAAEQLEDYSEEEDFTDSGVGCTDDCLDPVEPFTDPATVPDEYLVREE
jgi:hypothetical protein